MTCNHSIRLLLCACVLVLVLVAGAARSAAGEAVAVVSNIMVVSDKVEDVSSIEAWKRSVIKEGMTDEEKVLAAWKTTVRFRHHDGGAPREFLSAEKTVNDGIKQFNVYGYGAAPAGFLALVRSMGYEARGWTLWRWGGGVEVKYGDAWHYLDPGLICYFRREDGAIASVAEVAKTVQDWFKANPGYFDPAVDKEPDIKKMRADKKFPDLPALIRNCPTYDKNGSFMFNYFGWYTAMLLFSGVKNNGNESPFIYEEADSVGYRLNIQLRRGETLVRNWGDEGLHVNMTGGGNAPEVLNTKLLYYTAQLGDLSNGRVGNGKVIWQIPLVDLARHALTLDNIATVAAGGAGPLVHAQDAQKPASFVLRRSCSYVYLKGMLSLDAVVGTGGRILLETSDTNGLSWKPLATITESGKRDIDLQASIQRKYDVRLRVTLNGAGTGVNAASIAADIQHSQAPLPALGSGENTISFHAGKPQGTITIEPAPPSHREHQPSFQDFAVQLSGIDQETLDKWSTLAPKTGGHVVVPIETPGDITGLRFGCAYRAGADEALDLEVSFDDGKTFAAVDRAKGPAKFGAKWVGVTEVPRGTKRALVRYRNDAKGSPVIFHLRVDADYAEPAGGFAPVEILYEWQENGVAKKDRHVATKADDTYVIRCESKPTMTAISLRLADVP
jgi:hypothetical protein